MRGFTLGELVLSLFLVSVVGVLVLGLLGSVYYFSLSRDMEAKNLALESAYPKAVRDCLRNATSFPYRSRVSSFYYDRKVEIPYECEKISEDLYRLELEFGGIRRTFYYTP